MTRASCRAVDDLARTHLDTVDRKMADLRALRRVGTLIEQCSPGTIADCRIIESLEARGHVEQDQHRLGIADKTCHAMLRPNLRYEAITVQDICEAANVGRSTFYAHYTSKDDLRRSGIDDHLRKLLLERQQEAWDNSGSGSGRPFGFSLAMFEHARDHKEHYRALAGGPGRSVALGAIREVLSDLVRNELSSASPGASTLAPPRDLTVHFVTGAYMAVLTWWLDGGAKLTPEKMDAMFRHLATQGVIGGGAKHGD